MGLLGERSIEKIVLNRVSALQRFKMIHDI